MSAETYSTILASIIIVLTIIFFVSLILWIVEFLRKGKLKRIAGIIAISSLALSLIVGFVLGKTVSAYGDNATLWSSQSKMVDAATADEEIMTKAMINPTDYEMYKANKSANDLVKISKDLPDTYWSSKAKMSATKLQKMFRRSQDGSYSSLHKWQVDENNIINNLNYTIFNNMVAKTFLKSNKFTKPVEDVSNYMEPKKQLKKLQDLQSQNDVEQTLDDTYDDDSEN